VPTPVFVVLFVPVVLGTVLGWTVVFTLGWVFTAGAGVTGATGIGVTGATGFLGAHLPSPEDICGEVKSYELYYPDNEVQSTYNGTVYVVMNHATASSAEMGVSASYYVKNAVRVGSGSLGCSSFGECVMFQLPNSKMVFHFGHKFFYHEKFEEGKGFLPDFWIDDEKPVTIVEKLLKNK